MGELPCGHPVEALEDRRHIRHGAYRCDECLAEAQQQQASRVSARMREAVEKGQQRLQDGPVWMAAKGRARDHLAVSCDKGWADRWRAAYPVYTTACGREIEEGRRPGKLGRCKGCAASPQTQEVPHG